MRFTEAEEKEMMMHIREHMTYPATKKQVVEACNYMAHVPQGARDWVSQTLSDRTYNSADDVIHALGLEHSH